MIKQTLKELLEFIKNPTDTQKPSSFWEKLQIILILLAFEILLFILIIPLFYGLEYFVFLENELSYKHDTIIMSLLGTVIIIPILEELFFRFILRRQKLIKTFFSQKTWDKIFPYLVYITSIWFGFGHLSNFNNEDISFYLFSPIIIGSQLIGGFVLTFVRVRFHILWAILYHSLWNLLMLFISLGYDYFYPPYQEKTEHYKIEIVEKSFYYPEEKQSLKIDSFQGKIYRIEVEQYRFQHFLDTLYQDKKYQIDDAFIQMKFESKKGVNKKEFLEILEKEYTIKKNP